MAAAKTIQDQWAQWLLERRFGGDPDRQKLLEERLYPVRDRVLDRARVAEGDTLLDVGAGDGLIAFGALSRVGERGKVIFSDISQDLLDRSRELAEQMGVRNRLQFLHASADDLSALQDASVDAVTTRSVLIYVADKPKAFQEFCRVLKPGGRLSIHEPINRFAFPEAPGMFLAYDAAPIQEIAGKLRSLYERLQPPDTDPMLDFDERDLLDQVEAAGFHDIHLEYCAWITPAHPRAWETFLHTSGNPKIPTVEEAIEETLTREEAQRLTAHLRPLVEAGQGTDRMALADLWATR
jgi:ubiquinone/menaquinone biosynthesis C-methylase UbiE